MRRSKNTSVRLFYPLLFICYLEVRGCGE